MLSRRDFLKISGITTIGFSSLFPLLMPPRTSHLGRIITTTQGFYADSVHPILGYSNGWVRLKAGSVPETHLQPMLSLESHPIEALPAWVMVAAPYAAVRQYCAADAPLLARPAHGAMLEAVKMLDDRYGKLWLQVDLGNVSGWVQAAHIQKIDPFEADDAINVASMTALIEDHNLRIFRGEQEVARFAVALPANLMQGEHRIIRRTPNLQTNAYKGVPWVLQTDSGLTLTGAYWHNNFGRQHQNPHVELSVLAARHVFALLPPDSRLIVR